MCNVIIRHVSIILLLFFEVFPQDLAYCSPIMLQNGVIILSRTMFALYKTDTYISKSCVEQCLEALA